MTIVYISGPMRNHRDRNEPAFRAAADRLRGQGYQVIVPHDISLFVPGADIMLTDDDMVQIDTVVLDYCDAIYMLPGWQKSKGAVMEHEAAEIIGLTIWEEVPS